MTGDRFFAPVRRGAVVEPAASGAQVRALLGHFEFILANRDTLLKS